jgi:hypothetical protein
MANLLSPTEIASITGSFGDVFDTFKKEITIWKEPIKKVSDINTGFLFGYDNAQADRTNFTFEPVSGMYSGIVIYGPGTQTSQDKYMDDANFYTPDNKIRIKVEENARSFINSGENDRAVIDDKSFKFVGVEKQVDFLTKRYYCYELEDLK